MKKMAGESTYCLYLFTVWIIIGSNNFFFVPGTGLCDVSLADRILCVSELDPSITPSKLHDIKLCIKKNVKELKNNMICVHNLKKGTGFKEKAT